jgi:hypothetical protein
MEQHPMRLQPLLPRISQATGELSLYRGDLTPQAVISSVAKIKQAFPGLPAGFYEVFAERIKENGFCDARLRDAVACVIDNCIYPMPTIAQFISFDRRVKYHTYEEMLKITNENEDAWKNYQAVNIGLPKKVWFHVNDIAKYKIKNEDDVTEIKTD